MRSQTEEVEDERRRRAGDLSLGLWERGSSTNKTRSVTGSKNLGAKSVGSWRDGWRYLQRLKPSRDEGWEKAQREGSHLHGRKGAKAMEEPLLHEESLEVQGRTSCPGSPGDRPEAGAHRAGGVWEAGASIKAAETTRPGNPSLGVSTGPWQTARGIGGGGSRRMGFKVARATALGTDRSRQLQAHL